MPGSRDMLGELWIFTLSGDTKADLKVEVTPRKKTGLSNVARTTTEGGHKGSKSRVGRIRFVHCRSHMEEQRR